ncbi:MAG: hypothetical protein GY792_23505 [Gammaproteobacteria bacterium]|nr:hypothetical protein [Gammaproteobacteria bacterium]
MIEKSESNQLFLATAPILGQAPSAPASQYSVGCFSVHYDPVLFLGK